MHIATTQHHDFVVIALRGDCTGEADASLLTIAMQTAEHLTTSCIWLDCQHLTHIDYCAMRSVLKQLPHLETAGIALRLCGLQPAVQQRFETTGLASLLALAPAGAYRRSSPR